VKEKKSHEEAHIQNAMEKRRGAGHLVKHEKKAEEAKKSL